MPSKKKYNRIDFYFKADEPNTNGFKYSMEAYRKIRSLLNERRYEVTLSYDEDKVVGYTIDGTAKLNNAGVLSVEILIMDSDVYSRISKGGMYLGNCVNVKLPDNWDKVITANIIESLRNVSLCEDQEFVRKQNAVL